MKLGADEKVRIIVFRAVLVSVLYCGLTALALEKCDGRKLDCSVAQKIGIAEAKIEICVQRPQSFQSFLEDLDRHSQLFTAMFGHFDFEKAAPLKHNCCGPIHHATL